MARIEPYHYTTKPSTINIIIGRSKLHQCIYTTYCTSGQAGRPSSPPTPQNSITISISFLAMYHLHHEALRIHQQIGDEVREEMEWESPR
jgi:hypothetical protein